MHLIELKTASDLKLGNVAVEFTTEGSSTKEILLSAGGARFLIKKGETYSDALRIYRMERHRKEERHALEGTVLGLPVQEAFTSEREANERKRDLERADGEATLAITKKMVAVDADDKPVKEDMEMPF